MDEIKKPFGKIIAIIETAKKNAYWKVNEELINMYWCVGQFISEEAKQHPMEMLLLMILLSIYRIHFRELRDSPVAACTA